MVASLLDNGSVLLVTRKGKTRVVTGDDPLPAKLAGGVRFRYSDRFPSPDVLAMAMQSGNDSRTVTRTPSGSAAAMN